MLFIFDDLISQGVNMKSGMISNLYTAFRHANISIFNLV